MERILKSVPPKGLIEWYKHRSPKPTIWDHLPSSDAPLIENGAYDYSKKRLRSILYREQRGICCYCNTAVRNDHTSSIEHFLPRTIYVSEIFNYYNLLLSCNGGKEKYTDRSYHCDHFKDQNVIKLDPSKANYLKDLVYDEFGGIYGRTEESQLAIQTLGLDCSRLSNRRSEVMIDFVFNNSGAYWPSSNCRRHALNMIFAPIEFKYQILQVLKTRMNKNDRLLFSFVYSIYVGIKRICWLWRIVLNLNKYNYTLK